MLEFKTMLLFLDSDSLLPKINCSFKFLLAYKESSLWAITMFIDPLSFFLNVDPTVVQISYLRANLMINARGLY